MTRLEQTFAFSITYQKDKEYIQRIPCSFFLQLGQLQLMIVYFKYIGSTKFISNIIHLCAFGKLWHINYILLDHYLYRNSLQVQKPTNAEKKKTEKMLPKTRFLNSKIKHSKCRNLIAENRLGQTLFLLTALPGLKPQ